MPETIIINTDGSCAGNPGPGGFAAVIEHPKHGELVITGGDPKTTNNRMELSAVIEALKAVNSMMGGNDARIVIRSDSKYVIDALNKNWVGNWKRNGWRTASKQPVKNIELWEKLLHEIKGHTIVWEWVKGHNGDPMNERCDHLAVEQAETASGETGYWAVTGAAPKQRKQAARQKTAAAKPKPAISGTEVPENLLNLAMESLQNGRKEAAVYFIKQALTELGEETAPEAW